jgi:ABC-2 type transport system ATP-binding protein
VEIDRLSVRYGHVTAVDELTLHADAGEVLALLGPNGAGKTTTVETLEGFRPPSSGTVRVSGLDPWRDRRALTGQLGVMLQSCRLYSAIRPIEALRLFAAYYPDPHDPAALLERVGLQHRARTAWRRLSGGEQQRLALALALVGRPRVVVLDEPTAGLDVEGRLTVRAIVDGLRSEGVCVLLTSHELGEVEKMADRIAVIDRGRLRAVGTAAELLHAAGREEIRFRAPATLDRAGLAAVLGLTVDSPSPGAYVVALPATAANLARITGWLAEHDLPLSDLSIGGPGLEEVFLGLTGDGSPAPAGHEPDGTDPS